MANYALDTLHPAEPGLTVNDLGKLIRRRRMIGLAILGGFLLLAIIFILISSKRYTATGTVQVQKQGSTPIDVTDIGGASANQDAIAATTNQETQASILQSDTLALSVIKKLNLEQTPDFEPHFSIIGSVLSVFSPGDAPEAAGTPIENSPHRRAIALKRFSKNLVVKVVPGTSLIQIDYTNPDPKLAAAVVNQLIAGLTDFAFQAKLTANSEAATWLNSQLGDLRKKSEDDQARLAALQKDADLFSFGTDNTGHEQVYSDVLDKLQQSTAALSAATQNRIAKEGLYKAVRSGNAELISELGGSGAVQAGAPVANSLNLIQSLRLQQSALEAQIAEAELKYGSAYPRLTELHAGLDKLNRSLNDEVARVAARAKNDYEVALQNENQVRAENTANRRAADTLKDKAVDYTILREEANQSRSLYEDMLKKLNENGVLQGLKGTDLTVVDPGRVPDKPSKPNVLLDLGVGLALGILFGFSGMLIAEGADGRVQSIGQIEQMGIPLIGILPKYGKGAAAVEGVRDLRTLNAPKSAYSEAVRSVRASLVPIAGIGSHLVIIVTSAAEGEGKSLTARNLAVSVAQQGKRVVLVGADFRSSAGDGSDFSAKEGLSSVLTGATAGPSLMQVANLPNLFLLPSGTPPINPAELLGSPRMKSLIDELRAQFEIVLIDSPPVLPVVDTVLLSGFADSIVLVAQHGVTDRESLGRAYQLLATRAKPDSIAVVLNGVSTDSDIYRSYFGKTTAHYYQEDAA
jgi:capsular exopolysaccharide synthesis family protein